MLYHTIVSEEEDRLWQDIIAMEGCSFRTSRGLMYSYRVKRSKSGDLLGEIIVDRKEKTITRATIWLAYQKAREIQSVEESAMQRTSRFPSCCTTSRTTLRSGSWISMAL